MLLAVWGMCSSFYVTRAMIGRKKINDSLEKKKTPAWIWRQSTTFFFTFSLFLLWKSINQRKSHVALHCKSGLSNIPGSSMQMTIPYFVQLVMLSWITTESQFLTIKFQLFHASSEWMNPLQSERKNRQSLSDPFPFHFKIWGEICNMWNMLKVWKL